jgi:hypothetical protein
MDIEIPDATQIGGTVRCLTQDFSRNMTATRQRLPKLPGGRCCLGGPSREESGWGRAGRVRCPYG